VRRWFAMRLQSAGARIAVRTIVLDRGAIAALAELMGISDSECRRVVTAASGTAQQPGLGRTAS
jgi:hypothetical protein